MDELNLRVVRLDVERGKEAVVVSVVDQLGVLDDDCLVGIVIVLLQALNTILKIANEGGRDFDLLGVVNEAGSLQVGEDTNHFDENVNEFEDFSFVDLLVNFVLADVVSHVKEGNELELQLLLLESELDLHALQGVGFDD